MQPHYRHQASLEGIFELPSSKPTELLEAERTAARQTFYHVVDHFAALETELGPGADPRQRRPYSKARLVRFTYEYALSALSQDIYLRAFFRALALDLDTAATALRFDELAPLFAGFAEYLMDNFFLPCGCFNVPASLFFLRQRVGGHLLTREIETPIQ